jgi:hypothetical protein
MPSLEEAKAMALAAGAGSLSTGTLRDEDIFSAIRDFLPESLCEGWDATEEDEEKGYILNEDACDWMNSIAPPGMYFGSHPGDGADFGFWTSEDEADA